MSDGNNNETATSTPGEIGESYWERGERDAVTAILRTGAEKDPILQFFHFAHLPMPLADVSFTFARQACFIRENVPGGPERTVAFRKLLESKDAAVRAKLAPPR